MALIDEFDARPDPRTTTQNFARGMRAGMDFGPSDADIEMDRRSGVAVAQTPRRALEGAGQMGAAIIDAGFGALGLPQDQLARYNAAIGPSQLERGAEIDPNDPAGASDQANLFSGLVTAPALGAGGASKTFWGAVAKNAGLGGVGAAATYQDSASIYDKAVQAALGAGIGTAFTAVGAVLPAVRNSLRRLIDTRIKAAMGGKSVESLAEDAASAVAQARSGVTLTGGQATDDPVIRAVENTVGGRALQDTRQAQALGAFTDVANQARAMSTNNVQAPALYRKLISRAEAIAEAAGRKAELDYTTQTARAIALDARAPAQIELKNLQGTIDDIARENADGATWIKETLGSNSGKLADELFSGPVTLKRLVDITKGLNRMFVDGSPELAAQDRNALYKRLRSALHSDVEQAKTSTGALELYLAANNRFAAASTNLKNYQGSLLGSLLGTKTSVGAEKFLGELAKADPSVKAYTRRVLDRTDPALLAQLRRYSLTSALDDARSLVKGSDVSKYDIEALSRRLFNNERGLALFSADEQKALKESAAMISKILSNYQQAGPGASRIDLQEAGRLVGGLNRIFLSGFVLRRAGGTELEQILISPQGRGALQRLEQTSTQGGAAARVAAGSFLADVLFDRQSPPPPPD
jgi:hypothetical protein